MSLEDNYLSITQASEVLGVTRQTIHRWIRGKEIPGVEKVGRATLIPKFYLRSLLKSKILLLKTRIASVESKLDSLNHKNS